MTTPAATQEQRIEALLHTTFGSLAPAALAQLQAQLTPEFLAAGDTLMRQGEPGDAMHLVLSGRLRAYVAQGDGEPQRVREMGRGQVVGEMSLLSAEARSATVRAVRDSQLLRLDKDQFDALLQNSPQVGVALTRELIRRLKTERSGTPIAAPTVMGLFSISDGVDLAGFAAQLALHLSAQGRTCIIDRNTAGWASSSADVPASHFSALLSEAEACHDFVLLLGDAGPSAWTQRCSRHCDELLLLADASQPPLLHAIETDCLAQTANPGEAAEILILLHGADARSPRGTAAWLARRPVADHFHIRPALSADMARLARLQSRRAVGLVLAGGGARGFAHLGVLRALREQGVPIDCVGGTSMGALMATLVASEQDAAALMALTRKAFQGNPTGDFNGLPLISLIKGRRLRRTLQESVQSLMGFDADIEDLWINTYCVATNFSQAREEVMTRGNLQKVLRASAAIPGALPPVVHGGDLLCDGGTFNNFPVDVMRARRGIGQVVGVDLSFKKPRQLAFDEVPSSWALLRDRLRPRGQRRYKLPSLPAYLLNVSVLYSQSRQLQARQCCDVYFNPPLERVGLLEWTQLDAVEDQGYRHALDVLARQPFVLGQTLG